MSDTSDKAKKTKTFDDLRFMRIFTPDHVPRYLVEQVKNRDWEVDDWYAYQKSICLHSVDDNLQINPLNHLYVIADSDNCIAGFFWGEISLLERALVVQTFSMDSAFWHKGQAVKLLEKHAKKIKKEANLKKIYWVTNYPKHSERYGFKRSKSILMELGDDDGKDTDGRELNQAGEQPDEGTAAAVQCSSGTSATASAGSSSGGAGSGASERPAVSTGVRRPSPTCFEA